ncbi:MAG: hypothetical protein IJU41_01540 [Clostridia bacterium]|nr:hypothetical protein [Clostridia bacterium]
MSNVIDSKDCGRVRDFIMASETAFAAKFERNKVNNIDISSCEIDASYTAGERYAVVGSVETTSPTGKLKTYMYRAAVDVVGKKCALANLEILPLEG